MLAVLLLRGVSVLLGAWALIALLTLGGSPEVAATAPPRSVLPEPPAARAFVTAQKDHDATAAARVTSPFFRAELERRGQAATWPFEGLWAEAAPQLDFRYVGAVANGQGFVHALYTARPHRLGRAGSPTSLWRIDLDPQGRVIWGEPARLFAHPEVRVIGALDVASTLDASAPPLVGIDHPARPCLTLGVRSEAGDGYLALGFGCERTADLTAAEVIAFATIDTSGELLPSHWTFGEPVSARDAAGNPVPPRGFDLTRLSEEDALLLRAYLDGLS
jgi:hypothetical protein